MTLRPSLTLVRNRVNNMKLGFFLCATDEGRVYPKEGNLVPFLPLRRVRDC